MKWSEFPVKIGEGILVESGNVLICSPFLGHVSRLSTLVDELLEVSISFFGKSSMVIVRRKC
jgi:hypothetical protein